MRGLPIPSLPGLTRQSIFLCKKMDARVKPAHDGVGTGAASLGRREFITALAAAAAWPLAARAQQPAMPIVGFFSPRSPDESARLGPAFRKALNETGYIEGQNVTVEYHWLEGQYDRLPALMADLVRRRVAVIATPGQGDRMVVQEVP